MWGWGINILALLENLVDSFCCELHCYIATHSVVHISESQVSGILDISTGFVWGKKYFPKSVGYRL